MPPPHPPECDCTECCTKRLRAAVLSVQKPSAAAREAARVSDPRGIVPTIYNTTPAHNVQRFDGKGLATCIDQDPEDGTLTFLVGSDFPIHCPKCKRVEAHDLYLEARGDQTVSGRVFQVCAVCYHETRAERESLIGQTGGAKLGRTADANRRQKKASRARGRAARDSRRRNR